MILFNHTIDAVIVEVTQLQVPGFGFRVWGLGFGVIDMPRRGRGHQAAGFGLVLCSHARFLT